VGVSGVAGGLLVGMNGGAWGGEMKGGVLCAQRGAGGSEETGWWLGFDGGSALVLKQAKAELISLADS